MIFYFSMGIYNCCYYWSLTAILSYQFIDQSEDIYQKQVNSKLVKFIPYNLRAFINHNLSLMKQTNLLDSFLKRQKKDQESCNQNEKQRSDKKSTAQQRKKMMLDSDSENEEDLMKMCKQKIQEIKIEDQKNRQIDNKMNRLSKRNMEVEDSVQMDIENEPPKPKKQKVKRLEKPKEFFKSENEGKNQENYLDQFTDATPIWAQKQHCKDANMRSPDHPDYDPTTLHIPDNAWGHLTAPMKQFWKIKSKNFDKLVLFKLGKFYEMFYDDAWIGNKYLDLKFMGTKMHSGFPQKTLDKYVQQFVKLGFKTVIVEQMETPDQMQERIKVDKAQGRKSQKTINRQITQVLTKGTLVSNENQINYLPNYLISIYMHGESLAFALLEISSNQILLGFAEDLDRFKTILFQTRPVEVIFNPDNIPFQIIRMMEKSFLQMQISKVQNKNNIWHPLTAICLIEKLQKEGTIKRPKILTAIDEFSETNKNMAYATLSGMFEYLKQLLKFDYVIYSARFTFYQKQDHTKNMILDSQALQHLEIFETMEGQKGSLFEAIDRTKTKFGKRLLRRWIMSPLMNTHHINQRLNALQDLQDIAVDRQKVSNILKRLPDMDKKINKLYHYAIKTTSASKAVYFEDINTARLKQFKDIMEKMEQAWEGIEILRRQYSNLKSIRLRQLITLTNNINQNEDVYYEDEDDQSTFEGLLPDIIHTLKEFKQFVKWEKDIPLPQKGLAASYDRLQDEISNLKQQLEQYLESIRYLITQPNLKYVHTKERYEIQIPEKCEKKRPKDFEFTSKRAGFSRYISPTIKKYVKTLQKLEEEMKEQMGLFIGFFFEEFKKKQKIWQRYIEILAELDCLIGLSEYSFLNSKTRPSFSSTRKFHIEQARHPCLLHIDFIPNDIILDKKIMLLTGPNMGGKSTILRTVCTLAILAQIGCYVSADRYECQVVDRIFTRIGASDKLELGKSTFFIQMEETKNVLTYGTEKSLAIIDQLGRGTSTFDGMSIAYSVLKNLINKIGCYCLFATHYHVLIQQFERQEGVSLMMMDSMINDGKLIFLYKLVEGHVQQSFGLNVAKLVGICPQTIRLAEEKAGQMTQQINLKRKAIIKQVIEFIKQ